MERYNFNTIEKKWQKLWDDKKYLRLKLIKN